MIIAVIDGLGGNIGKEIIARLRANLPELEIVALATNAVAASSMMKAGANRGASGENAIRVSIGEADLIVAPIAVVTPNSMMGEVTPAMAEAIASAPGEKILLPLSHPKIKIVGTSELPLPHLMEEAIEIVKKRLEK